MRSSATDEVDEKATCGVTITSGRPVNAAGGFGSPSTTSNPAADSWPDSNARTRAALSMIPPRVTLTRKAPRFMAANR